MPDPLRQGVWGVVATPFHGPELALDERSLAREIEHYVRIGATGLTVLGVFGEATRLDPAERRKVLRIATEVAEGVPLVVGITSLSTEEAANQAADAVELAGDQLAGVMLQVSSADPDMLATHLDAVHRRSSAGIVVQHYPRAGGAEIDRARLVQVVKQVPAVVGVKCESAPTILEVAALAEETAVPAFGGLGGTALLDELAVGSAGAMTGFSCPEGLIACVGAFIHGGISAATEAWLPYLPLVNFEFQQNLALGIRKESLRRRGLIAESGVRPPAPAMPPVLGPLLDNHLQRALTEIEASRV